MRWLKLKLDAGNAGIFYLYWPACWPTFVPFVPRHTSDSVSMPPGMNYAVSHCPHEALLLSSQRPDSFTLVHFRTSTSLTRRRSWQEQSHNMQNIQRVTNKMDLPSWSIWPLKLISWYHNLPSPPEWVEPSIQHFEKLPERSTFLHISRPAIHESLKSIYKYSFSFWGKAYLSPDRLLLMLVSFEKLNITNALTGHLRSFA
jgi:hypothetical protein